MSTEELSQKHFSRERVRNRMVKRAAEVWGFSESEMDDFDPLVILLIEACAVEFEKMAGEIGKTSNRMMERLAQLLYPGTMSVQPAYGLVQVVSSEPSAVLYPEAQFIYKPAQNDRKRDAPVTDVFFSPSHATKIVDGSVRYIASGKELFSIEDGVQKRSAATAAFKNIDLINVLWLGVELNEDLSELDGISFFFNWINEPESERWYPYLPYTHWSSGGIPLQHKTNAFYREQNDDPANSFKTEFDAMRKTEESIVELFRKHYITLSNKESMDQLKIKRMTYPPAFEQLFDVRTLKTLKDPLLWIAVRFPPAIPPEALHTVFCGINVVPVLNRKLNRISYKLGQSLNIIPLQTEDNFLSVKEIVNNMGQGIKLAPFSNPDALEPESYSLRYGVNRFDERSAYEILVNLTDVIKEENSFFSSLGEDFLIQNIREMKQTLARLEEKIKTQQKRNASYPYLAVRSGTEGAHISIEFWSSNGESAGKIPIGSKLTPYGNSHVRSNSLFFITPTYGGRDKFSDVTKIEHYKKLLVTHNRIVTSEDLKRVVQTELGSTARNIEYKKAYVKSRRPGEGFIRCMQIIISPAPASFDGQEWQQRLQELQLTLEKQSVNNIPFQIMLATSDPVL